MALRPRYLLHPSRGNRLVTAPATEPVTLAELKTHLRITGTDEDTFLTQAIEDARQEVEDATGLALLTQTWRLTLDRWPPGEEVWWDGMREGHIDVIYANDKRGHVILPRYPLQSITSVTVYDDNGDSTVVTVATTFDIDTQHLRGRMALQRGATWPIATQTINAIEIVYVAGYGANATDVPSPIRRAIRQMAAHLYEHRGDGCEPGDSFHKSGAKAILDRYRATEV